MQRTPSILIGLLAMITGVTQAQSAPDFDRIAAALTERMALRTGERVLLVGVPGRFDPLVPLLRERIVRAGAVDLGAMTASAESLTGDQPEFARGAPRGDRAQLARYLRDVDVAVMLPGAVPTDLAYAAVQDVLREGRGRSVHFHWSGAYDAGGTPLPMTSHIDAAYQHALFDTDYAGLASTQRAFEAAMRGSEVRVTTPAGTDLRFRIGDRPVTRQDGDASAARAREARNLIDREVELPAGAIRVAPIEESVHGTIVFPPSVWSGSTVRGLSLHFEHGRIARVETEEGHGAVIAELDAGGTGARYFREFALGFNPLLAIPGRQPWIPYYGYGAGVVRLSLGDNSELGGAVTGGYVRWNFFTDATVTVGEVVWVRDGTLTIPQ